ANALGLTYLYLKQLDRAKLLFDEVLLAAKKPGAELHMLFARNYERTNYPVETEREIKRALAIDPLHPRANFLHGYFILLHAGSERLSEAGVAFENELKVSPEDFYSNFFVGVVATSESNHEKAIRYLKKAIQLNSQKSEAYLFLAQSQIEMGDLVEAEKNLRQARLLESKEADSAVQSRRTHFLLGRILIRTGRKEEGEKELKTARELQDSSIQDARDKIDQILGKVVKDSNKPADLITAKPRPQLPERVAELAKIRTGLIEVLAQAYHNLGVISVRNGLTDDAVERFEAGTKWKPDSRDLNRSWGIVSFRASRFAQAIGPLSRGLKADPNDSLVRRMLGLSYYFTEDFSAAVETLKPIEASIYLDPELAYFYGISLTRLKNGQSATVVFEKLAQTSQDNSETLLYAAQGFMISGDHQRAVKELKRVVTLNPSLANANFYMGQSLIRLNRYAEAEQAFRSALRIEPSDASSRYHLAFTLIERKTNVNEAISLLNEALALRPGYADAHYQLGKIYLERGEGEKAIENLEAAARSDGNKDYIYYQLSLAYRRSSRKAEADQALKTYQELKANSRKGRGPMGTSTDAQIQ
ncbi:MAG: tetratricopeptide repeat protein, partial [bacterium]|nr:tetratricopeptide repeat protein [bacterium]